jgi:hypothetical protein
MKLWKSPALYFGILLLLAVSGALLAPYLVDWASYRGDIERLGANLTGRAVRIDGPISIRIFPLPRLTLDQVSVANAEGSLEPDFLTAKRVEANLTLVGLLNGEIRVESMDVLGPVISLERMSGGEGSWQLPHSLTGEARQVLERIKLDQIAISGGTVNLIDRGRRGRATLEHVNGVISAPGLGGPWRVRGRAEYDSRPFDIAINTGQWRADEPFRFGVRVAPTEGAGLVYSFDGADDGKTVKGGLRIEPATRADGRSDPEGELRPLVLTAKLSADGDSINLEKLELAPRDTAQGSSILSGSAHISLGSDIKVAADLSATRFDFDALAGAKAKSLLRRGGGFALLQAMLDLIPRQVEFEGSLRVASLVAGGASLDRVKLSVALQDDALRIRELSADLPGQARGLFKGLFVSTDAGPQLLGDLSGEAASLKDFVQWAWPEALKAVGSRWTGSRGRFKVEAQVDAGADHIRFQDAAFQLNESLGKGSLALQFGERRSASLDFKADRLDLDDFISNGVAVLPSSIGGWGALAAALSRSTELSDLTLALNIGELTLNRASARNVVAELSASGKGVDIKMLGIEDAQGARLSASGLVTPASGSVSASLTAQDPRGLLQLLGLAAADAGSGWTAPLGDTDLKIEAGVKPDGGGLLATLQMKGRSGPLSIDGVISATPAADWLASDISGSAVLSSESSEALAELAGFHPVSAPNESAKITVTATGSARDGLLTDIQAEIFGARAQYQGTFSLAGQTFRGHGRAGLFADRAQGVLDAIGLPAPSGVASFESDLDLEPGRISLPSIKGMFAGEPVSGKLTVENGSRITGDIACGLIRLPDLLSRVFMPWTGEAPDLEGAFSTAFPGGLTGELWLKPATLEVLEGFVVSGSQIGITVKGDEVRLAVAGKNPDGQDVQLEVGSQAEGGARKIEGRLSLPIDLAQALATEAGAPIASGAIRIDAKVAGTGRSPASALASLEGTGIYEYRGARLQHVDPAGFSKAIAEAHSSEDISRGISALLDNGEIDIGDGRGSIKIENGNARFEPVVFKSEEADLTLTPSADLPNGSIDVASRIELKAMSDLPPMSVSYIGIPGGLHAIVDSNALESYLGLKVLQRNLDELERVQREQQKIYEEEERRQKEDEARLKAFYEQRDELDRRSRELKVHRINREIQAEMAKAEAERALKEYRALNRAEMTGKVRELRVLRRAAAERDKAKSDHIAEKVPPKPAVRVPLPRSKASTAQSSAAAEPLEPLVLVPPAQPASDSGPLDLLDLLRPSATDENWLKRRAQNR